MVRFERRFQTRLRDISSPRPLQNFYSRQVSLFLTCSMERVQFGYSIFQSKPKASPPQQGLQHSEERPIAQGEIKANWDFSPPKGYMTSPNLEALFTGKIHLTHFYLRSYGNPPTRRTKIVFAHP